MNVLPRFLEGICIGSIVVIILILGIKSCTQKAPVQLALQKEQFTCTAPSEKDENGYRWITCRLKE